MSPEVRGTSNFSCGGGLLKFLGLVLYYRLFLISVFQIFRDLLYRRTKEQIAPRPSAPSREEFHTESTEYTEKAPRIFTYLRVCFLATNLH